MKDVRPPTRSRQHPEGTPTLSVLVLTYNHSAYICDCLTSILQNAIEGMHVWVLDDGSSDQTAKLIANMAGQDTRVTLLTQPNSGGRTAENTQRLIDESSGEFIMFMSGDDMLGPSFPIARSLKALAEDSNLAMILPRLLFLQQEVEQQASHIYKTSLASALCSGDPNQVLEQHLYKEVSRLFLQGVIIRRDVVDAAGGFNTALLADDYAFMFRLFRHLSTERKHFMFDPRSVWLYRVHTQNVHQIAARQFQLILEVVHTFVPPKYWSTFRWDVVAFETIDDLAQARQMIDSAFSDHVSDRLIRRMERKTLRRAQRNNDAKLIRAAIRDTKISIANRSFAILNLMWLHIRIRRAHP
ncbi:glycosyltransferase family A protein [Gymnodinialimonas sp. 2305UL16-5]|uniref:glycosyltransferase n=1 Tax=Gymnodinialimonas mytili TaxID=3126503 RepID=UPI0030A9D193